MFSATMISRGWHGSVWDVESTILVSLIRRGRLLNLNSRRPLAKGRVTQLLSLLLYVTSHPEQRLPIHIWNENVGTRESVDRIHYLLLEDSYVDVKTAQLLTKIVIVVIKIIRKE
jgi:hypothetical protein